MGHRRHIVFYILWVYIWGTSTVLTTLPDGAPSPGNQPKGGNIEGEPSESQKLYKYVQIIKNIDIEESMESVVELMHMLRIIFPLRFAKIKQKMYAMYDPATNRDFGQAFQALINIMRVESNRKKLHEIFNGLMIPEETAAPIQPSYQNGATVDNAHMKIDLPVKYKGVKSDKDALLKPLEPKKYRASSSQVIPDTQSTKDSKPGAESPPKRVTVKRPVPISSNAVLGGENKASTTTSPVEARPNKKRAKNISIQGVDLLPGQRLPVKEPAKREQPRKELGRKELQNLAESVTKHPKNRSESDNTNDDAIRVARLKNLLDQVKKNSAADPKLQARAARLAQTLSQSDTSSRLKTEGKLRIKIED